MQSISSDKGDQLAFLVLRSAGSGSYTVVGRTGLVTLAGAGLETFRAHISVQAGDILGQWVHGLGAINCARDVSTGGGWTFASFTLTEPNLGDTYDFVAPASFFDLNESATLGPTSKDQCKNGGWKDFGTTFKNQGDCVSFVATGGKNG
jgi:hypothetical protein